MSTDTAQASTTQCGACEHENKSGSTFCAGCGQGLYEACVGCSQNVLLSQKFCGGCGADLAADLEKRLADKQQIIAAAIASAKSNQFERALGQLDRAVKDIDYRFSSLRDQATKVREKVAKLHQDTGQKTQQVLDAAKDAFQQDDFDRVVSLLSAVAEPLLDDDSARNLHFSQDRTHRKKSLQLELRAAVGEKRWTSAGEIVGQLLELNPDKRSVIDAAEKISLKLRRSCEKLYERHDYKRAADALDAIPGSLQNDADSQLRHRVDTAGWLATQFDAQPFATSTLGRLAVRFSKTAPANPLAQTSLQRLSTQVKQSPPDPRAAFALLGDQPISWLGGPVSMMAIPTSVETTSPQRAEIRSSACGFGVAIGLALQGLGQAQIETDLAPKKGKLASLVKRKKMLCWGVDVGSAGIRAVKLKLEKGDAKPVVSELFQQTYDVPACRLGGSGSSEIDLEPTGIDARGTVGKTVQDFVASCDMADTDVWTNLPASDAISRFLQLPPVKDVQAEKLLDDEIRLKIPFPEDQLAVVRRVAPVGPGVSDGRPAMIVAAKKDVVARRLDWLAAAGLTVTGLQVTPLALANFAAFEFVDLLDQAPVGDERKAPAVALVDAGASMTTLVYVSKDACLYWTIEQGSEDLTSRLARSTKLTKAEAEQLKINPAGLQHPKHDYQEIEAKLDELRHRLTKASADLLNKAPYLDPMQTWCFGGGSKVHDWARRVVCK